MADKEIIKPSTYRNEHQKAILNLYSTVYKMLHNEKQFLNQFGITSQQYNILRILKGQNQNPITIKEIRSRMLDNFSDTGRIIARLEKKEWVKREYSSVDKRSMSVIISKKGEKILQEIDKLPLESWNTGIHNISEQEANKLNSFLDKIN